MPGGGRPCWEQTETFGFAVELEEEFVLVHESGKICSLKLEVVE